MVHGITSLAEEKLFYGNGITSLAEEKMLYGAWDYFSGRRETVLWCMGLLL